MKDIQFRAATEQDALYLAQHLREADVREVVKMGMRPASALLTGLRASDLCLTAELDGKPVMMLGATFPVFGTGEVWALGTDDLFKLKRELLHYGREFVRYLLDRHDSYANASDADYKASHNWLRRIGFKITDNAAPGFVRINLSRQE